MPVRLEHRKKGPLIATIVGLILMAVPIIALFQMLQLSPDNRGEDFAPWLTAFLFGLPGLLIGVPGIVLLLNQRSRK